MADPTIQGAHPISGLDIAAPVAVVASWSFDNWIATVAAVVAVIWYVICIAESQTARRLIAYIRGGSATFTGPPGPIGPAGPPGEPGISVILEKDN